MSSDNILKLGPHDYSSHMTLLFRSIVYTYIGRCGPELNAPRRSMLPHSCPEVTILASLRYCEIHIPLDTVNLTSS